MYAFERFLEINEFLLANEFINCKFFLLKNDNGGQKSFSFKKKKSKIVIRLPFWIAKIFNISSFCQILIPLCFSPQKMKNFFNETKNIYLKFFSVKFYFFGLQLAKFIHKKIIKKNLKAIFLKRFSKLLIKIREFFFSTKKKKLESKDFENLENIIFLNLTRL